MTEPSYPRYCIIKKGIVDVEATVQKFRFDLEFILYRMRVDGWVSLENDAGVDMLEIIKAVDGDHSFLVKVPAKEKEYTAADLNEIVKTFKEKLDLHLKEIKPAQDRKKQLDKDLAKTINAAFDESGTDCAKEDKIITYVCQAMKTPFAELDSVSKAVQAFLDTNDAFGFLPTKLALKNSLESGVVRCQNAKGKNTEFYEKHKAIIVEKRPKKGRQAAAS